MTRAEREEAALRFVCPVCHCEAGTKCQSQSGNNLSSGRGWRSPPKRMKTIHRARLALVLAPDHPSLRGRT